MFIWSPTTRFSVVLPPDQDRPSPASNPLYRLQEAVPEADKERLTRGTLLSPSIRPPRRSRSRWLRRNRRLQDGATICWLGDTPSAIYVVDSR